MPTGAGRRGTSPRRGCIGRMRGRSWALVGDSFRRLPRPRSIPMPRDVLPSSTKRRRTSRAIGSRSDLSPTNARGIPGAPSAVSPTSSPDRATATWDGSSSAPATEPSLPPRLPLWTPTPPAVPPNTLPTGTTKPAIASPSDPPSTNAKRTATPPSASPSARNTNGAARWDGRNSVPAKGPSPPPRLRPSIPRLPAVPNPGRKAPPTKPEIASLSPIPYTNAMLSTTRIAPFANRAPSPTTNRGTKREAAKEPSPRPRRLRSIPPLRDVPPRTIRALPTPEETPWKPTAWCISAAPMPTGPTAMPGRSTRREVPIRIGDGSKWDRVSGPLLRRHRRRMRGPIPEGAIIPGASRISRVMRRE
mmetsp:Transcript_30262/g.63747  ORF Transcript_30262/g.63747 Transcript_30262/m.63747 type:complete len:361 (+) Transcript_30262:521-1603(+)